MKNCLYKNCIANRAIKDIQEKLKLSSNQIKLLTEAYLFEEGLILYSNGIARLKYIGHMFCNTNTMMIDKGFDPFKFDTYSEYLKTVKNNPSLVAEMKANKTSGYTNIKPDKLTKDELTKLFKQIEELI